MKLKEHSSLVSTLNQKIKNSKLKLRNNIRAREIFREIDRNTYKDFSKLITISNKIVTHIRDGSNINKEFRKTKKEYELFTHNIMNKTIYSDCNNLNRKRILFEKEEAQKDINNINFLIRVLRSDVFPKGVMEKDKKNSSILDYYKENYIKKKKEIYQTKNNSFGSIQDIRKKNFKMFSQKLIQDNKTLQRNINDYLTFTQSFVNMPKKTLIASRSQENLINSRINEIQNNIEMLNYKKKLKKNSDENKKSNYIKFEGLLKYSRSCHNISKDKRKFNNSEINTFYKLEDSNQAMSNTSNIVKNLMKSNINFPNRLIKKEQKFNSLIDNSLPKVEDYDLIIKNVIKQKNRNNKRRKTNIEKIREKEIKKGNKFYNSLNEIYNEENIKWKKDEELKKLKLKIIKKERENNLHFLRQIEKNKRFISKFSDPYSQRNGYNNYLEDFSNILGRNSLSKEDIFHLTRDYFSYKKKEENEKKEEIDKLYYEKKEEDEKNYIKEIHLSHNEDEFCKNGKDVNGNDINYQIGYKSDSYKSPIMKDRKINKLNTNKYYLEFLESKKILEEKNKK